MRQVMPHRSDIVFEAGDCKNFFHKNAATA